jgi:hypothetical protein
MFVIGEHSSLIQCWRARPGAYPMMMILVKLSSSTVIRKKSFITGVAKIGRSRDWSKQRFVEAEIGQSRDWSKLRLVEAEIG